jgi:hypothetical protein
MLDVGMLLSQDVRLVEFLDTWKRAVAASARTGRRTAAAP